MHSIAASSKTIAATGGVASGKSVVEGHFLALGVHVYNADVAAREVVSRASAGLTLIVQTFGRAVVDADGNLDRAKMRQRIFSDPSARQKLESITHPLIRQWLRDRAKKDSGPYCLLAIPLLAENIDHYRWVDRILVVDAPESMQMERLMARDDIDETLARKMLAAQASRAERLALADDVIDNSGDEAALDEQVAALHQKYLALAAAPR